ncbi:Hypothetical protein FSTVST1_180 [Faustovirus ST1]|nr:Hypothetical protein FSTVST1_180 [Faustovirus ST1]
MNSPQKVAQSKINSMCRYINERAIEHIDAINHLNNRLQEEISTNDIKPNSEETLATISALQELTLTPAFKRLLLLVKERK